MIFLPCHSQTKNRQAPRSCEPGTQKSNVNLVFLHGFSLLLSLLSKLSWRQPSAETGTLWLPRPPCRQYDRLQITSSLSSSYTLRIYGTIHRKRQDSRRVPEVPRNYLKTEAALRGSYGVLRVSGIPQLETDHQHKRVTHFRHKMGLSDRTNTGQFHQN